MASLLNFPQETSVNLIPDSIPKGISIDLMSIDVEGHELDVLQSNDWMKFRPRVVMVEQENIDLHTLNKNRVYRFMVDHQYRLVAVTPLNLIFQCIA